MGDARGAGTPDTTYDLVSAIYHALQGAEAAAGYAEDAEEVGDGELAAFFREARQQHRALAERAKGLLAPRLAAP